MANNVLSQQYVDIVARGLEKTLADLKALQGQADRSGQALRKVGGGGGGAGGGAGGGGGGGMGGLLGGLAGGIAGGALAAVGAAGALVAQGFSGTTEMEQFGQAVTMIGRELASLFAPALQLAADLMKQLVGAFQATGASGQKLLGLLSPLIMIFDVFGDPRIQSALKMFVAAFTELQVALAPIRELMAGLYQQFLDTFVIEPLVMFIKGLTLVVLLVKELSMRMMEIGRTLGVFNAFGKLPTPERKQVTLNQTGTEDAQGTFQRIQQAILKSASPMSDEAKRTEYLKEINGIVALMKPLIETIASGIQALAAAANVGRNLANRGISGAQAGVNMLTNAVMNAFGIR